MRRTATRDLINVTIVCGKTIMTLRLFDTLAATRVTLFGRFATACVKAIASCPTSVSKSAAVIAV